MNDPSDMDVYLELAHNCGWQKKTSFRGSEYPSYYTISMNSYFIKYVTYQVTEVKTLDKAVYKWFHTCYVNCNISLSLCIQIKSSMVLFSIPGQ